MVEAAASVEWIVASTEVDALMLEYNLIQQHKPRFNIRYRDDKSYPYLALTVGEKWPRAQVLRGTKRKGVRYFGPYGHAWAIRDTLDALTRVFPVRTCSNAFFDQRARAKRPCLYYDIGRCAGPCVPETTGATEESYREHVDAMAEFLAGNARPVLQRLEREMRERVGAPGVRAGRAAPRPALRRPARARVAGDGAQPSREDLDVIALAEDDLEAAFQVFFVRGGRVLGRKGWVVDRVEDLDRAGLSRRSSSSSTWSATRCRRAVLVPAMPSTRSCSRRGCTQRRAGPRADRGPGAGSQAQADRGRRSATPPTRSSDTSCGVPRTSARARARSPSWPSSSASNRRRCGSSATTSRTSADRQGRLDGGLRGRPAETTGLPAVPDQGRAGTGRLRVDAGDAPPPVHAVARGAGARPATERSRRFSYPPALVVVDGGRGQLAQASAGARGARPLDPARRSREATRGGVLPRPARPA